MEENKAPIILEYRKPYTPRRLAQVIRWCMFALAIIAIGTGALCLSNPILEIHEAFGGGTLGTPFAPLYEPIPHESAPPEYVPEASAYFAIFLLTQWLFLTPRRSRQLQSEGDSPLSHFSTVSAGFIGMLLSIGLLATLMEIPNWWLRMFAGGDVRTEQHFGVMWAVMAVVWIVWTCIFYAYSKGLDHYTALRKIFRWLVAGTILELLIAAPAHALILRSRGDDCYCERGTWTGVAFGCTAALWLFGPGAFLLFLRERRRRQGLI